MPDGGAFCVGRRCGPWGSTHLALVLSSSVSPVCHPRAGQGDGAVCHQCHHPRLRRALLTTTDHNTVVRY